MDTAVFDAEGDFGEFGCHAQKCGQQHPNDRAGAAADDGGCHARDVAGTDDCGDGRHRRLKRSNVADTVFVAAVFGTAERAHNGLAEEEPCVFKLEESETDREIETDCGDQNEHDGSPDDSVDEIVSAGNNVDERIHKLPPAKQ